MASEFDPQPAVEFLAALYAAGWEDLAGPLAEISDNISTALVLGHNPGWEEVVHWLTRESVRLTTANAALVECETDSWSDVVRHAGNWSLKKVIRPKEI